MLGYRFAVYNQKDKVVDIGTWSENGDRIVTSVTCYPYFYYEDLNGDEVSIFNTKIKKKEFENYSFKRHFLKERGLKQVFDNYNPVQQSLIDTYWQNNEDEDFANFPLKIYLVDIEAVGKNGFSTPTDANDEINVITVYDSIKKRYIVWGLEQYAVKQNDVYYNFCTSEQQLLNDFVDFMRNDPPDIVSGWNSDRYDIPYIVNRIKKILGEDRAKQLSPYNNIYTRTFAGKFGKEEIVHRMDGISCVDYMDIYKKFCPVNRESYKLDYIGQVELEETKVDYGNQSLYEFMVNDWETFVDYNIQDVRLLVRLEERLKYVELLRMLAYVGCTTFEAALGTVSVVTGAAAIQARKRNQRLSTFLSDDDDRQFKGGYVSPPLVGHHKSIVTFDANSLYPNTMITLNTSPETKLGKIISVEKDKLTIRNVDGVTVDMSMNDFANYVSKEKIAISRSKVLFSQKKKGIFADMVDSFYKNRVKIRKQIKDLKLKNDKLTEEEKIKITQLDTKQQVIKIFINSTYGAFANNYCSIQDKDIAESITLTGQAVIKEAREIFKRFIKEKTDIVDEKLLEKGLVAGDTDSLMVSLYQIFDDLCKNGKIKDEAYQIVNDFEKYLNENIKKWAVKSLNTSDCRFEFKREKMCDYGLFLEKKRYVLHVLDNEGIPCNDWKYTGVEVVRTTMPKAIKPYVKKIVENMIMTKSESITNKTFSDAYDEFLKMDLDQISLVSGIRNLEKYEQQSNGFSTCKGMPCHVKAAYYYNLLIDELGISNKYEKINSGDKIKYFFVETPNMYGIEAIAYKTKYPEEFKEIFKVDIHEMFEKDMYKCIERFYNCMNWVPRKPTDQLMISLDDLLS